MDKAKVVVALITQDQDFQKLQAEDAARAATKAGMEAEVIYARNNATLQSEQIYRFLHAVHKPVAILAHPVSDEGLARVARDAAKLGIAWVQLGREAGYVDVLRKDFPSVPISIVRSDQLAVGRIQGEQIRKLLPNGGNILYIQGPSTTFAAQQRTQGMQAAIAGAGIEVETLSGEWTMTSAEQALTSWLRLSSSEKKRIDLIAAQNDDMAVGARKAVAARRPEWLSLPFTGCDGLPEGGQKLVNDKQLAATVILQSNAGPAIDLVAAHLKSGNPAPPRLVLQPKAFPK